jgi:DNA invertase Pin-like site-specific DNA recombinase
VNKRAKSAAAVTRNRKRAVLYARVSTPEQEREGFSIPSQVALLKEYAAQNGIAVAKEFIDVETAKKSGRTNFEEMLRYLRTHSTVDVVLVEKTDRLYRNIKDWVTIDDFDVEIHLVKENVVLSRDSRSSEKFMHGIKVLMAKNYIDNLSEETRKGMLEKARQGLWPSFAPIGYRNIVATDGKRIIVPDPETAPMITRMYEWFESGRYALKDISRMAKEAGLRNSKTGKPLGVSTIHVVLRNRIYTGSFHWLGRLFQGTHEPLVSHETWENVQEVLDGRSHSNVPVNVTSFRFSGLVNCGHCGCVMTAEIKKGRYVYYHCSKAKGKCPEPYVREELLGERLAAALSRLRIDDEVSALIQRALRESHADERRERDEILARLRGEADRLQARLDALYTDKLDGTITSDYHDRMAAVWREERTRCLNEADRHYSAEDALIDDGIALLGMAGNAHRSFFDQPKAEQKSLLNMLISNCSWANRELSVTFRQPFDILEEISLSEARVEAGDELQNGALPVWLPGPNNNPYPPMFTRVHKMQ